MPHKFPLPIRIIACLLVIIFLVQDVVWAHPDALQIPLKTAQKGFGRDFGTQYDDLLQKKNLPPRDVNASFGEGVGIRHILCNNVIAFHDMTMGKKGPHYSKEFYEREVPAEKDNSYDDKIKKASLLLKFKSVKIFAEALLYALFGIMRVAFKKMKLAMGYYKRSLALERDTTFIYVDMPRHFLLSGTGRDGKPYYQLSHLGRRRKIIFLPKKALQDFDAQSAEDIKQLATILNHDQMELDLIGGLESEGLKETFEGYEKRLNKIHEIARQYDPFKAAASLDNRIELWLKIDKELSKPLRLEIEEKTADLAKSLQEISDHSANPSFIYDTARLSMQIGYAYDVLGNAVQARNYYEKALYLFLDVTSVDTWILPIYAQLNIVRINILLEDYASAAIEFKKIVNFSVGGKTPGVIDDDFKRYAKDILKDNFMEWLNEISAFMIEIAEESGQAENTLKAYAAIEEMTLPLLELLRESDKKVTEVKSAEVVREKSPSNPAIDFSKQRFVVDRGVSINGRTALETSYWQSSLNEFTGLKKKTRCEFEIAGIEGKWVPLIDEHDQVVIAHVLPKNNYKVLDDYFVFRSNIDSSALLLDKELKDLGIDTERLVYYAKRGVNPIPVRIPVSGPVSEVLTSEALIGYVKAGIGGCRLLYYYGQQLVRDSERWSGWLPEPDLNDTKSLKAVARPFLISGYEETEEDALHFIRHKEGARVPDFAVLDYRGSFGLIGDFGYHNIKDISRKNVNGLWFMLQYGHKIWKSEPSLPDRITFYNDDISPRRVGDSNGMLSNDQRLGLDAAAKYLCGKVDMDEGEAMSFLTKLQRILNLTVESYKKRRGEAPLPRTVYYMVGAALGVRSSMGFKSPVIANFRWNEKEKGYVIADKGLRMLERQDDLEDLLETAYLRVKELETGSISDRSTDGPRKEMIVSNVASHIYPIARRIAKHITDFLSRGSITNHDISSLIWALHQNELPRDREGSYRPFTKEEIFTILSTVNQKLVDLGFAVDERFEYVKTTEPIDQFAEELVDGAHAMSIDLKSLNRLITNIPALISAANIKQDEFPVFLARDAVSAAEFMKYRGFLSGKPAEGASIYQPGMASSAVVTDYVADKGIEKVLKAGERAKAIAIEKLQLSGKIPSKKSSSFYDTFHPEIYLEIARIFKEEMIRQWDVDRELKAEAELLYLQMEKLGIAGRKNPVIIDMAATGKSVLYVKTVLEYFSQQRKIDIGNARVFIGYSHDRKMCLPEVRLFNRDFDDTGRPFKDQTWPFYRARRDERTGQTTFKFHERRSNMLIHLYRSLSLYNAAINSIKQPMTISDSASQVLADKEFINRAFSDTPLRKLPKPKPKLNERYVSGMPGGFVESEEELVKEYAKSVDDHIRRAAQTILISEGHSSQKLSLNDIKELKKKDKDWLVKNNILFQVFKDEVLISFCRPKGGYICTLRYFIYDPENPNCDKYGNEKIVMASPVDDDNLLFKQVLKGLPIAAVTAPQNEDNGKNRIFSGLNRAGFFRFVSGLMEKMPEEKQDIYSRIKKAFLGIEGAVNIIKFIGIPVIIAEVAAGQPVLGVITAAAFMFLGGISRFSVLAYYKIRYRAFIKPSLFLITLIPMYVGITLSMLSLVLPTYSIKEVNHLRNIEYKVGSSLKDSDLENEFSESESWILRQHTFDIASDIRKYQAVHFSEQDPWYRKTLRLLTFGKFFKREDPFYRELFRIRPAVLDDKSFIRTHEELFKSKRLLFIDSRKRIEAMSERLRALLGPEFLKRIYFYDTEEFLINIGEGRHAKTESYVKHLFPETVTQADGQGLEILRNEKKNAPPSSSKTLHISIVAVLPFLISWLDPEIMGVLSVAVISVGVLVIAARIVINLLAISRKLEQPVLTALFPYLHNNSATRLADSFRPYKEFYRVRYYNISTSAVWLNFFTFSLMIANAVMNINSIGENLILVCSGLGIAFVSMMLSLYIDTHYAKSASRGLVKDKMYKYYRHPVFLCRIFAVGALLVMYPSFSMATPFILLILVTELGATMENIELWFKHGKSYEQYAKNTPTFLEWISNKMKLERGKEYSFKKRLVGIAPFVLGFMSFMTVFTLYFKGKIEAISASAAWVVATLVSIIIGMSSDRFGQYLSDRQRVSWWQTFSVFLYELWILPQVIGTVLLIKYLDQGLCLSSLYLLIMSIATNFQYMFLPWIFSKDKANYNLREQLKKFLDVTILISLWYYPTNLIIYGPAKGSLSEELIVLIIYLRAIPSDIMNYAYFNTKKPIINAYNRIAGLFGHKNEKPGQYNLSGVPSPGFGEKLFDSPAKFLRYKLDQQALSESIENPKAHRKRGPPQGPFTANLAGPEKESEGSADARKQALSLKKLSEKIRNDSEEFRRIIFRSFNRMPQEELWDKNLKEALNEAGMLDENSMVNDINVLLNIRPGFFAKDMEPGGLHEMHFAYDHAVNGKNMSMPKPQYISLESYILYDSGLVYTEVWHKYLDEVKSGDHLSETLKNKYRFKVGEALRSRGMLDAAGHIKDFDTIKSLNMTFFVDSGTELSGAYQYYCNGLRTAKFRTYVPRDVNSAWIMLEDLGFCDFDHWINWMEGALSARNFEDAPDIAARLKALKVENSLTPEAQMKVEKLFTRFSDMVTENTKRLHLLSTKVKHGSYEIMDDLKELKGRLAEIKRGLLPGAVSTKVRRYILEVRSAAAFVLGIEDHLKSVRNNMEKIEKEFPTDGKDIGKTYGMEIDNRLKKAERLLANYRKNLSESVKKLSKAMGNMSAPKSEPTSISKLFRTVLSTTKKDVLGKYSRKIETILGGKVNRALIGPVLRELSVPADIAIKEFKKSKKLAWLIKLPLVQDELIDMLNTPAECTMNILRDENGTPYLYLERGDAMHKFEHGVHRGSMTASSSDTFARIAEALGHSHPRGYDAMAQGTDLDLGGLTHYDKKRDRYLDRTTYFILSYTGALEMSIKRPNFREFDHIREESDVIRELQDLGLLARPVPAGPKKVSDANPEEIIKVIHELTVAGVKTHPLPQRSEILLSSNLFTPDDMRYLSGLLGEDSLVKICAPDKMLSLFKARKNVGCVLTESDYSDKDSWGKNSANQNNNKVLVLGNDLKGPEYLYLEGVVGLVRAMMNEDREAIGKYMKVLFNKTEEIEDAKLIEILLQEPGDFSKYIRFKSVMPFTKEELLEKRKADVENYLINA